MKTKNTSGRVLMAAVIIFLFAPIIFLIVFSFNSTKSRTILTGFSLKWYAELFKDAQILNALYVTILISVIAAVVATVAGTFAAVGLFNMKKRPRAAILSLNNIPVINADIITGVSLSLLFVSFFSILERISGIKLEKGFATLLIAHITFNVPYVILSVMPKLQQLDVSIFEAAQDLGATWRQAFFKVVVPQIMPGIINGLIIAFTMSVDDFVISYFSAGRLETLSMSIYSMTKKRISPEINALSTIMFVFVLAMLIIINFRQSSQDKKLKKSKL